MNKYKIVYYNDKDTAIGSRPLKESEIGRNEVGGIARFEIEQTDFPVDTDYIVIRGVDGTPDPMLLDLPSLN